MTKDLPQGMIGIAFAEALVSGRFNVAYAMLTPSLQNEYSNGGLRREYEFWIHHSGEPPMQEVLVLDNREDIGKEELDSDGWAYVAIEGDGWSEAVSVTVKRFEDEYRITELVWGRP